MLNIRPDSAAQQRNLLLDSLAAADRALLAPHLRHVTVPAGVCVSVTSADTPVACFPVGLIASVIETMADGSRFEVGLIGAEGVIGWPLVPAQPAAQSGVAQAGGGSALVIPLALLPGLCARSDTLHAAMLGFVHSFTIQMSMTIVANLRDGIDRRLARRLLMLHDRVEGDALPLTHGDLATALHVRRASITDTLHVLEGERVLRCTRGQVVIRDRAGLRTIAGDNYGQPEASYRALIGPFGKG